jgi:hypothetical protein
MEVRYLETGEERNLDRYLQVINLEWRDVKHREGRNL